MALRKKIVNKKLEQRINRKERIRKKVHGTGECPRMSVFKSLKHLYVQVIDDVEGKTLASVSTLTKEHRSVFEKSAAKQHPELIGQLIAKACKEKNISKVVFDRNGYPYHGKIEIIAKTARENGIIF